MIRYQYIDLTGSGAGEHLENALSGLGERKRKIRAFHIAFTGQADATANAERFRVYVEQLRVVDIPLFLYQRIDSAGLGKYIDEQIRIPVDIDLDVGEGFQVGFQQAGAGVAAFDVVMEYEDL